MCGGPFAPGAIPRPGNDGGRWRCRRDAWTRYGSIGSVRSRQSRPQAVGGRATSWCFLRSWHHGGRLAYAAQLPQGGGVCRIRSRPVDAQGAEAQLRLAAVGRWRSRRAHLSPGRAQRDDDDRGWAGSRRPSWTAGRWPGRSCRCRTPGSAYPPRTTSAQPCVSPPSPRRRPRSGSCPPSRSSARDYLPPARPAVQARQALPGEAREFAISEGSLERNPGVVVPAERVWMPGFRNRPSGAVACLRRV